MGSFKGGFEEAAKMLQVLGGEQAKRLIEEIRAKDPEMAQKLSDSLIRIEDLQYISAAQLVGLLRDLNLEEFGLALRTVDKAITEKILSMVSAGIRLDINDGLSGPPRRVSEVNEAQAKIVALMRAKIDKGELVLSSSGDEMV